MHIISFTSPLGIIQVKGDNTHIYSVTFVDVAESNSSEVSAILLDCVTQLQQYFKGERKQFTIPLNQNGTVFQQGVWHELQNIPYGKTISYLTLSEKLHNTKAIRAVGTANGKNNIAIIVPCHRVIGSGGQLTGYSGGLHRKQWLLEHESKVAGLFNKLF